MHDYKEALMGTIKVSAHCLTFQSRETETISEKGNVFQNDLIQNANVLKK
jgi:hypothetical protein